MGKTRYKIAKSALGVPCVDPLMRRWSYIYCRNGTFGMMRDWISQDFPMGDREFAELVLLMGFRASGFPKCSDHR